MADGFEIAEAFVRVRPDLDGFGEELQGKLEEATAGAEAKAKVGLDTTDLDAKADAAKGKVDELDGKKATATLGADAAGLDAKVDDAKAKVDSVSAKKGTAKLDADKAAAQATIDDLQLQLARLRLRKTGIPIDADASRAEVKIAELQAQLGALQEEGSGFSLGGLGGLSMPGGMLGWLTTGLAALGPGIGGAATGLGLLGGTGALAFGGIAKALSEAHQSAANVGMTGAQVAAQQYSNSVAVQQAQQSITQARQQAAQDAVTSASSIEQAQENLASTQRNAAASQIAALESVQQAQQGVQASDYNLREANYQLSQSYEAAREQIRALDDQLADSKLNVKAAQIAIEQAILSQRQVDSNAYSTSVDRQQAALAVAQAQQQLKDAQDQETASQYAANQANKQGVDGSQQVIQAKQQQLQATEAVKNAQQAYADAQRALHDTELNNAEQEKQAQLSLKMAREEAAYQARTDAQAVANAERNLTQTLREQKLEWAAEQSASNQASNQFARDMAKLTPAGRGFVDAVLALRGPFRDLEAVAQSAVLPGMTTWLNGIKSLLPTVGKGIGEMGRAMSESFAAFGKRMQTPGFAKVLDGLIANGVKFADIVLPAFAKLIQAFAVIGSKKGAVDGLANALADIAKVVMNLLEGAAPFTGALTKVVTVLGQALADLAGPLGQVIGAIGSALAPALQAMLPGFKTLADALGTGLATALTSVGPLLGVFGTAIGQIAIALAPVLPQVGQLIAQLAQALLPVATALMPAITGLVQVLGQQQLGASVTDLSVALGALLPPLAQLVVAVAPVIDWAVKLAGALIGITDDALTPLTKAILDFTGNILTGFVDGVQKTFRGIGASATWLWHNAIEPAFDGIKTAIGGLETAALWLWHHVFDPVWQGIETGAQTFVANFGTIWGNVESVFRKPVNFLIGTVYDKGIARFWNDVVKAVGLNSLKLPVIPTLAGGGMIPGYAPGRDIIPALLSPGEAVLTPGAARAIGGAPVVNALNAVHAPPGGAGEPGRFAAGGIINTIGSVFSGGADVAKAITALLTGNTTAFTNALTPMIGTNASGTLGRVMLALPKTLMADAARAVIQLVTGETKLHKLHLGSGPPMLPPGAGGLNKQVQSWFAQAVKLTGVPASWIPSLEVIGQHESSFNPLAVNSTAAGIAAGTPEGVMQTIMSTFLAYHQPGTSMSIFDPVANIAAAIRYIRAVYRTPDDTPGLLALAAGQPYTGYDSGGWLPPGASLAVNQTGQPEAVLNPQQWQAFQASAAQPRQAVVINQNYFGPQMPNQEQLAEMYRQLSLAVG